MKTKSGVTVIRSDAQVRSAAPGVHKTTIECLYLKRGEKDRGSWFYRYGAGGERKVIGLGKALGKDAVTLAQAKEAARKFAADRDNKIDPKAAIAREPAKSVPTAAKTFAETAEAYALSRANAKNWRNAGYAVRHWLGPIQKYAYPVIGETPIDQVSSKQVAEIIEAMNTAKRERTGAVMRGGGDRRQLQKLRLIINSAWKHDEALRDRRNPADIDLHDDDLHTVEDKHHRRIDDIKDARAIFRDQILPRSVDATRFAAWAFMIATAVRPSEALKAKWSEIDLERALWTIPKERMKTGWRKGAAPHVVPLSSLALGILKRQAKKRTGTFVFPGQETGSALSFNAAFSEVAKDNEEFGSPHSWRSVFRDWAGSDACKIADKSELAEHALAHALPKTQRAYRRSTAPEERRELMEAYAKWLTPAEVIPLRAAS